MSQELLINNESNIAYMKAELDTAIMTAQLIKRNIDTFMEEATKLITYNEDIAASCVFSLPRKKKNEKGQYEQTYIKGKSARLSEIILNTYENLTVGSRIIEVTAKTVTVEGCAWDLQKRTKYTAEITENINGSHSDAAKLAIGSATSKAIRNAIFKIVGPLADVLYKRAVDYAVGDQKTFPVKRAKVFERMKIQGVDPEKIFSFYGKKSIEEFTPELIEEIIGIGTAIKEGELKIDKAFVTKYESSDAKEKLETLVDQQNTNNKLSAKIPNADDIGANYEDIKNNLQNAKDLDSLNLAADLIRAIKEPVLQNELMSIYKGRIETFK